MPSYVVTGANRGLGVSPHHHPGWVQQLTREKFEFVRQYSADSKNIVVGLVRDKAAAEKKYSAELSGRSNVHLLQADVTDYDALKVRFLV